MSEKHIVLDFARGYFRTFGQGDVLAFGESLSASFISNIVA